MQLRLLYRNEAPKKTEGGNGSATTILHFSALIVPLVDRALKA